MQKLFLPLLLLLCSISFSQNHARRASLDIIVKQVAEGMYIDSVLSNSNAICAKLKKGDVLLSLNNKETKSSEAYLDIISSLRTGDDLKLELLRVSKKIVIDGKAPMRPLEISNSSDIIYDWVKFKNGYLRTIVRKPKDKTNVPCILLIPGYGCGSIENFKKSYNGRLIEEWLKNGYAVVTIEKSGVGDSYDCLPCADVNLTTDIESFNAGYAYMEKLDFADKSNLFIWGHSLGGIIAPEIAKLHNPKGVMVFGTVFRPWSEFLLEMHRIQKPLLDGLSYDETETFVRLIQKVYYEFFVLKKTPKELHANPEYKNIIVTELGYKEGVNLMWGRHWRFWQQLDSLNLATSWQQITCPVLIINGGSDYEQCAPIEPVLLEKTVNSVHPGNASRVEIADLDHFMMKSSDFNEAKANFKEQGYTKGNFNYKISEETLSWLNKQLKKN